MTTQMHNSIMHKNSSEILIQKMAAVYLVVLLATSVHVSSVSGKVYRQSADGRGFPPAY